MATGKGGDGKIDLAELEKLDKKLGGVKPSKRELKKMLDRPVKESGDRKGTKPEK